MRDKVETILEYTQKSVLGCLQSPSPKSLLISAQS